MQGGTPQYDSVARLVAAVLMTLWESPSAGNRSTRCLVRRLGREAIVREIKSETRVSLAMPCILQYAQPLMEHVGDHNQDFSLASRAK